MRWESASGAIDHLFDDEPVPGTQGIDQSLLQEVQPFPTMDLVPYDTAFLSGFVIRTFEADLERAVVLATFIPLVTACAAIEKDERR